MATCAIGASGMIPAVWTRTSTSPNAPARVSEKAAMAWSLATAPPKIGSRGRRLPSRLDVAVADDRPSGRGRARVVLERSPDGHGRVT